MTKNSLFDHIEHVAIAAKDLGALVRAGRPFDCWPLLRLINVFHAVARALTDFTARYSVK